VRQGSRSLTVARCLHSMNVCGNRGLEKQADCAESSEVGVIREIGPNIFVKAARRFKASLNRVWNEMQVEEKAKAKAAKQRARGETK
jgi:hypothetical protein